VELGEHGVLLRGQLEVLKGDCCLEWGMEHLDKAAADGPEVARESRSATTFS